MSFIRDDDEPWFVLGVLIASVIGCALVWWTL